MVGEWRHSSHDTRLLVATLRTERTSFQVFSSSKVTHSGSEFSDGNIDVAIADFSPHLFHLYILALCDVGVVVPH